MIDEKNMDSIIGCVKDNLHEISLFCNYVTKYFETHPELTKHQIIHSVKYRLKNIEHLRRKIQRKSSSQDPITSENIFQRITDIAGVRVLHLYQSQFPQIHNAISQKLDSEDWILFENPKAYTWDPDSQEFFTSHGLLVEIKESLYTSIHYVIRPKKNSPISCEIQVRTLFEEIWGEIDHLVNYSGTNTNQICRDQIGVLARLVGAGSRLADSIWHTYSESLRD